MVEQTYPSGKVVRNFFENDGDLAKVVRNGKTYVSDFSYNASGGINSLKLGNGRFETAEFNSRQQMTQIGLGSNATANDLWKVEFKYGELAANGVDVDTTKNTGSIAKQIITLPNVAFTQTYKYDALERLTEAKEVSTNNQTTWQQSWDYDRFGNRTAFNSSGIGLATINTTPAVNPNTNRFTSTDYQYDKAGNITKDISNGLVREFIFNGDNKQVHVKDANNVAIGTYYYDGNGARVKKTTANETTIFVYDGDGILVAEYSTATPTATPTISYTTSDHLGSPRVITDKNGNVTSRRDFMPFGEELNPDGNFRTTANKFGSVTDNIRQRFTGYQKDKETNLDFAEARYYNNQHGRFTAVDPLLASGKSSDPQTFNRYVYCNNNPIICTDPSGLTPEWYQKYNEDTKKTEYKEFDGTPDKGYTAVDFGGSNLKYYDGCANSDCSSTKIAVLYQAGGWGWSARNDLDSIFDFEKSYSREYLASRNSQFRDSASDIFNGTGGAGYNAVAGTYNFGAGIANRFGTDFRYVPEYTPTTGGQKAFYYGTNAAMIGGAGVKLFQGAKSAVGAFNTWRNSSITLYRGVSEVKDIAAIESGVLKSKAMFAGVESTKLNTSFLAKGWHSITSNFPKSQFVSATSSLKTANFFSGNSGRVYQFSVRRGDISRTFNFLEMEFKALGGTKITNVKRLK
jgi:RHS repeat-associated protein